MVHLPLLVALFSLLPLAPASAIASLPLLAHGGNFPRSNRISGPKRTNLLFSAKVPFHDDDDDDDEKCQPKEQSMPSLAHALETSKVYRVVLCFLSFCLLHATDNERATDEEQLLQHFPLVDSITGRS
jgi:hypothetical protein